MAQIFDPVLLASFRTKNCEWCGRKPPSEPHHVSAKGMGGQQIDHRLNLVALCFKCHADHHDGREPRKHQLESKIIVPREGVTVDEIETFINNFRRLPKEETIGDRPAPKGRRRAKRRRD